MRQILALLIFLILGDHLLIIAGHQSFGDCSLGTCSPTDDFADTNTFLQTSSKALSWQRASNGLTDAQATEAGTWNLSKNEHAVIHSWISTVDKYPSAEAPETLLAALQSVPSMVAAHSIRIPSSRIALLLNQNVMEQHPPVKWYFTKAPTIVLVYCLLNAMAFGFGVPIARWRGVSWESIWAVLLFFVVNPLMLLCNKVVVMIIPLPATVVWLQCAFAAAALHVFASQTLSFCKVEPLESGKVWSFGIIAATISLILLCSMNILAGAPIELMICVKACVPLLLIAPEYAIFNIDLPSIRSCVCLVSSATFMILFQLRERHQIGMDVWMWMLLWLCCILFDTVGLKYAMTKTPMSNWTRVYYTNALGLVPLALFAVREWPDCKLIFPRLFAWEWMVLALSCVLGLLMSYSSYLVRDVFSPVGQTLVSNSCKWLAILTNAVMWNQHSSSLGIVYVCLSLLCTVGYSRSPERGQQKTATFA